MKKLAVIVLAIVVAVTCAVGFAACDNPYTDGKYDYVVSIVQPMEHIALSQARTAFEESLRSKMESVGKTIYFDYKNANGVINDLGSIIDNFVSNKTDMIYAIATDAAQQAALKTEQDGGTIPVIFNAVTDPETANILDENVTGVSDMNPMEEQVELMQTLMGGGTDFTVGVLYTSSEANSVTQKDTIKGICEEMGINCVDRGIPDANDLQTSLAQLAKEADIVYLPTDNLLASIASAVHSTNVNDNINVPIVCGEGGMNDACGVATLSVNYSYLGKLAADIAFDILVNGKSPSEIPFKTQTEDLTYSINETVAEAIDFEIPQEVKDLVAAAQ